MYLGLCLVSVLLVVWAVTATAARPRARAVRPDDPGRPLGEIVELDVTGDGLLFDLADWGTVDAPAVVVPDVDLSQFGPLPPIYDPGLPVVRMSMPPVNLAAGPWPGSGTDWPRVA